MISGKIGRSSYAGGASCSASVIGDGHPRIFLTGLARARIRPSCVSGALIWRLESVPSASIVTGGPTAFPLLFDPDDELTHPGVAFWHAHSRHVVASLQDAIIGGDRIDVAWLDRVVAEALWAAHTERQARLDAGQEQPFWHVKIFPGITTSDRDELMAGIMEAATYQYGDHPLRSPARELAAMGKNVSQIADLFHVGGTDYCATAAEPLEPVHS